VTTMAENYETTETASGKRELPRAVVWLIWAGAVLIAYFVIVEPSLIWAQDMNTEADRLAAVAEAQAQPLREANKALSALQAGSTEDLSFALRLAEARLGPVAQPGEEQERATAFDRLLKDLVAAYEIDDVNLRSKPAQTMGQQGSLELTDSRYEVRRLVVDLQFTTTPATMTALLRDLEASPLVTAVSKTQITRIPDTSQVKCTVTPESWIKVRKSTRL
jgi:hypothetical protein